MIKVFIDTNVFIDYLARREGFFEQAALIFQLGQRGKCELLVSSLAFATASFILHARYKITQEAIVRKYAQIVNICHITPVDFQTIEESISSKFTDFEDAMQYYSALRGNANVIITRNKGDFSASEVPVYEPREFLDELSR